jgi:hypothetical protein
MRLGESDFQRKTMRTRKREFLSEMRLVMPWVEPVEPSCRGLRYEIQIHRASFVAALGVVQTFLGACRTFQPMH